MSALIKERLARIEEHGDDLRSALLILELIEEEGGHSTPRMSNLIQLGKLAIGSKLELLDEILNRHKGDGHE